MPALLITASSSGDNTLLAAVANKRIRVWSFDLFNGAATANTAKFRSNANDISLPVTLPAAAAADVTQPPDPKGVNYAFQTAVGEALNLNLSAATAVGGSLLYSLE